MNQLKVTLLNPSVSMPGRQLVRRELAEGVNPKKKSKVSSQGFQLWDQFIIQHLRGLGHRT